MHTDAASGRRLWLQSGLRKLTTERADASRPKVPALLPPGISSNAPRKQVVGPLWLGSILGQRSKWPQWYDHDVRARSAEASGLGTGMTIEVRCDNR